MKQDQRQNTKNLEKLKGIFMQPAQDPDSITLSLEALDSSNWEKYKGAGGNTKVWVQKLMAGEEGAFDECCEEIAHQTSFWPAIYLVFPYLVEKLSRDFDQISFDSRIMKLSMLGTCLATDFDINREGEQEADGALMENYQLGIRKFQLLIKKFLAGKAKPLGRVDSTTKGMFAVGVLAAFGNREDAAFLMDMVLDESITVACDKCEYCDEGLELADKKALSVINPREKAPDDWNGEDFEDTYRWFGDFLELFGIKGMAKYLPYYFGTYRCPECGREAVVRDLIKVFRFES